MPYSQFSWQVNTVCFNLITEVLNQDEFIEYKYDLLLPTQMPFCNEKEMRASADENVNQNVEEKYDQKKEDILVQKWF